MSSESQPLFSPSTVPPPLPSPLPWTLADEEALIKRENAISHLQLCIARRDQCEIDLINFRRKYSETVINADPNSSFSSHTLDQCSKRSLGSLFQCL
jgi:hypothetical protein